LEAGLVVEQKHALVDRRFAGVRMPGEKARENLLKVCKIIAAHDWHLIDAISGRPWAQTISADCGVKSIS
jgi:hypothetical protein